MAIVHRDTRITFADFDARINRLANALLGLGLDENAYLQRLLDDLRAHPVPASDARVDVVRWVEDAHRIGVADVYTFPGFVATGPPSSPITLDDAYYKRAQIAIDRQLQLAGVRLAALLNETLVPTR